MLTLIIFFALLLLGFPVALTLIAGTAAFIHESDLSVLLGTMPVQFYGALEKNGLLAIPLFMMVGDVMNRGGLTERLMAAADVLVGGFRGGLAYVNLLTNAMAASILGSAVAQISVMSRVMIPQMKERGYNKGFAAAVTVSGGLLGPIIPPSMLMIIYGVIAYQPIAALFIAGIIPGIVMFLSFAAVILLTGVKSELPKENWKSWKESRRLLVSGLIPGIIPLIIIVGIITGAMTPTESGAVASIIALVLGMFVYKKIRLREIPAILQAVAMNTAVITGLIAAASTFGWVLTFEGVPDVLIETISGMTQSPYVFLLLVNVAMIVLGMFLETISVMIIIVPILLPAVESMGIDLIHFGVIVSLGTVVGLATPPVGPGMYIAMIHSKIPIMEIIRSIIPFLAAIIVAITIINLFPALSVWLPGLTGLL
jgi:tripartite ATP-independent transporter DctM subunit